MLSAADGLVMPPATEAARRAAAVRRVSRAAAKFQLDRRQKVAAAAADEEAPPLRRLQLPRWAYPFAAAAMILIGWVAYWGFTNSSNKALVSKRRALESARG